MARHFEITGKAKAPLAIAVLLIAGWLFFGQSFLTANFGFFNSGYQTSFFRGGSFAKQGLRWDQHNRTLGHILSFGDEELVADLTTGITRGTLVIHAWRWPSFLYDEATIKRVRYSGEKNERLRVALPEPGIYILSASAVNLGGEVSLDWRVEGR